MSERIINCTINGIKPYGIFVECGEYTGLVHISEISDFYIEDINRIFQVGDLVTLTVLETDDEFKRLKLSYKQNHKIHKRIRSSMKIIIGFHSLKNQLPNWIGKSLDDKNKEWFRNNWIRY